MRIMRCFLGWLLIVIGWSCHSSWSAEKNDAIPIGRYDHLPEEVTSKDSFLLKQRAILKKYSFCKCLVYRYPQDSFLRKDGALSGYFEIGSYGNKAYDAVDTLIVKWCRTKYSSKYKRNLYLMQCLDLYNSPALDSLVKGQDRYLNRDKENE